MRGFSLHSRSGAAFSLVEVVLALGIVSFCLLAVVGLLPVGLKSVKNSNEESAAASAMNQISLAIRSATVTNGQYHAADGYSDYVWKTDGGVYSFGEQDLALSGRPVDSDARLKARVEIIAPANATSVGTARISVAWPNSSTWVNGAWANSEGAVSCGIIYLPAQL